MSWQRKDTTNILAAMLICIIFAVYRLYVFMETDRNIYIKNMVCDRCVMVVRNVLERLGLTPLSVELGRAELSAPLAETARQTLREALTPLGFELIDDPRIRTVEHIKRLIIELVHHQDNCLRTNLSQYLATECRHDYGTLSKLFSETQGTTIEKYFIAQKIARAKELLDYGELTLNEIADRLNYSSTAHLSAQFKAQTGYTPRQYRQQKERARIPLDKI